MRILLWLMIPASFLLGLQTGCGWGRHLSYERDPIIRKHGLSTAPAVTEGNSTLLEPLPPPRPVLDLGPAAIAAHNRYNAEGLKPANTLASHPVTDVETLDAASYPFPRFPSAVDKPNDLFAEDQEGRHGSAKQP